jgi:predicted GNAT family acetyltransferase
MTIEVHDEPHRHRYVITEDGNVVGFVTYRIGDGVIDLIHAEVDPDHGGRGLAGTLVASTLDDARRRGLAVLPHCPYVHHYIDSHPDRYLDLVPADRRAEFGWGD